MIIITGASGDLGKYLLSRFLGEGIEVIGLDTTLRPDNLSDKIRFEILDISDTSALNKLWQSIDFNQEITLINLVGRISDDPLMSYFMSNNSNDFLKAFEESLDRNLIPIVNCTISFSQHAFMNSTKVQVINFGSISSMGIAGQVPYGSAKGAVQLFSRVASVELGAYGVRINCIVPGYVDSPSLKYRISNARIDDVVKSSSLRKLVAIEDIYLATKFLHESQSISGLILEVHSNYGR